jgi:hypothetical protein
MYARLELILRYSACALSVLGAGSILYDRFYRPHLWNRPARQLLVWLSVADLFSALAYMIPASPLDHDQALCKSQAILGMFFPIASFLWTDCIAYYVYMVVAHLDKRFSLLRDTKRMFRSSCSAHCCRVVFFV